MTDPSEPPLLDKIRAMWEFAAITQFFYLFFDMFGLDDFDVEVFEEELTGVKEPKLISNARLRLLQGLSSNRAITLENLDEFTRKQYIKRKPNANPFGDEENPTSWNELDVFAQIRVFRQLCTWQLINAERFRERANVKDSEQLEWRVNPVGFDAEGNTYYLFDDNRLYYRDAPVIPEDKPSRKRFRGKKRKRGARRIESEEPESPPPTNGVDEIDEDATWHVQCISVDDYTPFLARLKKSRDLDEKAMYRHLHDNVLPAVIEEEKERERKRQEKEQEFLREQAYAARKRSNRLVQKEEDRKLMEEKEAELAKLQTEQEARKKEEQRLKKLEQEREARLLVREQRQRERELRIKQREEERMRAMEEAEKTGQAVKASIKLSASPVPVKKTSRQQALESQHGTVEPQSKPPPEESWFFDCLCGKHGVNYDDGTFTVACEKCEIWQHVDCLTDPRDREELNKRKDVPEGTFSDYEFVCARCRKKAKEASKVDAVKTKEQLRKEREREINKAKYERRKIREKARKEEERRKREEEARLGIQMSVTTNGGDAASSPLGERHSLGVSSSPVIDSTSPNRTTVSAGQLYTLPRFTPPVQYPNANPMPSHASHYPPSSNQNTPAVQYTTYPHPQQRPPQLQNAPPVHYQHTPQSSQYPLPPQASQGQVPRQPAQYPPLRPAASVQPYWSPYTTSSTLPNGQSFNTRPPYSAPYSNGVNPSQPKTVPIKPSPNTQYRPPQQTGYPQPSLQQQQPQQQYPAQTPAIQPRPPKSPEIQRAQPINSGLSRDGREVERPIHVPRQESEWTVPSYGQSNSLQGYQNLAVTDYQSRSPQQERNSSISKSPPTQQKSISPLMSAPPRVLPQPSSSSQQGYQQSNSLSPHQPVTENGLSYFSGNRPTPSLANVSDSAPKSGETAIAKDTPPKVNGVVSEDQDQEGKDSVKENERTKMSFLLN